jgi:TraM recognition site of TraD and TraG
MPEHAFRWNLVPGLHQRGRVAPDHDVRSSDQMRANRYFAGALGCGGAGRLRGGRLDRHRPSPTSAGDAGRGRHHRPAAQARHLRLQPRQPGVQLVAVFQNCGQGRDRYGTQANTIVTNFPVKVVMGATTGPGAAVAADRADRQGGDRPGVAHLRVNGSRVATAASATWSPSTPWFKQRPAKPCLC